MTFCVLVTTFCFHLHIRDTKFNTSTVKKKADTFFEAFLHTTYYEVFLFKTCDEKMVK